MALVLFLLMLGLAVARPPGDSDCVLAATAWIEALESGGCPPLGKYETAASEACNTVNWDILDRNQKRARKALFKDCTPSPKGFPGVVATATEARTLSRCGELVHALRGEPSTAPVPSELKSGLGYDAFMAAMATAVFACTDPDAIDLCRLPATVHTPATRIRNQQAACDSILSPPLDSTLRALAWSMGPMPVIPEEQHSALGKLLETQENERRKRAEEDAAFQSLRAAEPERARGLADDCMAIPGELKDVAAVQQASEACKSLLNLWAGDHMLREALIREGKLAERYAKSAAGKVLNSASLSVADHERVEKRPAILKLRLRDLITAQFELLITSDSAAAEALLNTYRSRLDPEFVVEATDRLLATE